MHAKTLFEKYNHDDVSSLVSHNTSMIVLQPVINMFMVTRYNVLISNTSFNCWYFPWDISFHLSVFTLFFCGVCHTKINKRYQCVIFLACNYIIIWYVLIDLVNDNPWLYDNFLPLSHTFFVPYQYACPQWVFTCWEHHISMCLRRMLMKLASQMPAFHIYEHFLHQTLTVGLIQRLILILLDIV